MFGLSLLAAMCCCRNSSSILLGMWPLFSCMHSLALLGARSAPLGVPCARALMRRRRLLGCSVFALRWRRPRCRPRYVRTSMRTASRIITSRVAFIGNFLDASATYQLACDIGEPDPSSVALFDTGAAFNASIGKLPVLKGSVEPNYMYISTANR
eukprot:2659619-Prymnesium_polylepis.1